LLSATPRCSTTRLSSVEQASCYSILARSSSNTIDEDDKMALLARERQGSWARRSKSRATISANRRPIFNIGMPRTGTISLHVALTHLSLNPCKWVPPPANLTLQEIAAFVRAPVRGTTMLHDLLDAATGAMWHRFTDRCDAFSDNPWWIIFPALMATYPRAAFVMTTRAGCEDWLTSMKTTWKRHRGCGFPANYEKFHQCVYGAATIDQHTASGYFSRCQAHERDVLDHAAAIGMPVLLLPLEWNSSRKWSALGRCV